MRMKEDNELTEILKSAKVTPIDTYAKKFNGPGKAKYEYFDDVQATPFDFVIPNLAAIGKFSILAGDGGAGKGSVMINAASRLNNGDLWFDGKTRLNQCSVAWASHEEEIAEELRPRAEVAGNMNLHKLVKLNIECAFSDEHIIRACCEEIDDLKLIVLDPIQDFIGNININDGAQVRNAIREINRIAHDYKVAIVGLHHLNKGNAGSARSKFLGSQAFISFPRFAWMVAQDATNEDIRYLKQIKGNVNKIENAMVFSIEGKLLRVAGQSISYPVALFDGQTSDIDLDECFIKEQPAGKLDDAKDFIFSNLSESVAMRTTEWEKLYTNAGISKRTMRRAEKELAVKKSKRVDGWYIQALPSGTEGRVN